VIAAFDAMGRPAFPTREQIVKLREAAQLAAPEPVEIAGGKLGVRVPTQGLALVEIR
jgi:xylan 1,4-beta-xylosidase